MRVIEHKICDTLKEAIREVRAVNQPVPKTYKLSERDSIYIFSDGTVGYKLWSTYIVKIDTRAGTVTTGSSRYWRSRTTNSRKRALRQVFGFPALDENITFDYIPNIEKEHTMPHFNHYQRGTREATVTYTPESTDVPYVVRMYMGSTLMDKVRTDTKPYAAKIAQQWVACKR